MFVHVYLFTFALGGLLLLASIFLGDKDGGHDAAHDAEADGPSNPASLAHDGAGDHGAVSGLFTAFLSLRFWMFFLAFFGLTGLVLDGLDIIEDSTVGLVLALVMGLTIGQVTVAVFRRLAHSETSTAAGAHDYIGKSGRVLVAIAGGSLGKLRLTLKGTTVDVLATTDEERPFAPGEEALVIQMNDTTAVVARVSPRADAG
ncbi:MAG: NfeD family protein [Myxococcales bacterium]|nr:NfeD family protein [Myxococcales bacterium]